MELLISCDLIVAMAETAAAKPIFPAGILTEHYTRIIAAAGGSLPGLFPRERIEKLMASKLAAKIVTA